MRHHLSINIRLSTDRSLAALCNTLVSQDYFRLTSLGGLEGHGRGDQWFLCVCAFKDFLDRFLTLMTSKPASIETLVALDGSNRSYLENNSGRVAEPTRHEEHYYLL